MKKWWGHLASSSLDRSKRQEPRLHRRKLLGQGLSLWGISALGLGSKAFADQGATPDPTKTQLTFLDKDYEAVVIGSGFGGAVTALRLSQQYGERVLIVERGKRYPRGSFARDINGLIKSFWRQEGDQVPRPIPLPGPSNGVFDLRSYPGMDTLVASGYGGGSLIYAAAIIEPKDPEFDKAWPETIKKDKLRYYFDVFKEVMAARPVPHEGPERRLIRQELFARASEATGGVFREMDVAINFGKNREQPEPLGQESVNAFGAQQMACRYCAECVIGCNYSAKNSLDLNYLYAAEHRYKAEVKVEHQVEKIIPLNAAGQEDASADGCFGYHVYLKTLGDGPAGAAYIVARTQRVIVAAGVYGTNELLLRSKFVHQSLPRISEQLGRGYSANGDFLNLVFGTPRDGSQFGPTVTLENNYKLEKDYQPGEAFIMEDLSYPGHGQWLSWVLKIFEPKTRLGRRVMGPLHQKMLEASQSGFMTILLNVGVDKSDGVMRLNAKGRLNLQWNSRSSKKLYDHMIKVSEKVKQAWGAKAVAPFPTYLLGRNLTVHPLGGCALADSPDQGVVDAHPEHFGAVFHYQNLYVADGSIIPSALGANPTLTIGALAEMIAEGITGQRPTGDLS